MSVPNRLALVSVIAGLAVGAAACSSSTAGSGTGPTTVGSQSSAPPATVTVTRAPSATSSPSDSSAPSSSAPSSSASSSAAAPSTSTHPVPAQPLRTGTATAPDGGVKYVIKVWAEDDVVDCVGYAYGAPIINFLKTHPCTGIHRVLATTTVNGKQVGFAQSAVSFHGATVDASYRAAGGFRTLVTKDGTGNIVDMFRNGYRLPSGPTSVPSPDAFSALAQDNACNVVDAWYLDGPTPANDPALVKMAQDIYLQF